jgi:crossover junction endodeoxyribonuclease RusA
MALELPWPPAKLSPNGSHGSHWAWAAAGRKYHRDCSILLKTQSVPKLFVDGPVMIELIYCPPTKRLCDLDNLLARTKHGIDALAEALGVDDQIFEYTLRRGNPVKQGKVLVCFHLNAMAVAA